MHAYYSSKAALRTYVNNLRGALTLAGSNIRVSSVNPFIINTPLPLGDNPIWTEATDVNNDPLDPVSLARVQLLRAAQAGGLDVSTVSDTYMQLLQSNDPRENVVVGEFAEPGATAGGNNIILTAMTEENAQSAMRFYEGFDGC